MQENKFLGFAVLIAWLSVIHILYPLPNQSIADTEATYLRFQDSVVSEIQKDRHAEESDHDQIIRSELDREAKAIWIRWMSKLAILVLGVAGGLMALRRAKYWVPAVCGLSTLYIVGWLLRLIYLKAPSDGSILETIASLAVDVANIGTYSAYVLFAQVYLVLPLFHFLIVAYLIFRKRG